MSKIRVDIFDVNTSLIGGCVTFPLNRYTIKILIEVSKNDFFFRDKGI